MADGWLAEIEELEQNRKIPLALLSQSQFTVWRATWLAQHQQHELVLQLTADIYEQAKDALGNSDRTFLALCNLRIQLLEASGELTERTRAEFTGNFSKTECVDENDRVLRGRSGRFDLSRCGDAKVITFYLDSTAEVGGAFIYHLGDDKLRSVSGMLANQPSLPEIELRVFRRTNSS